MEVTSTVNQSNDSMARSKVATTRQREEECRLGIRYNNDADDDGKKVRLFQSIATHRMHATQSLNTLVNMIHDISSSRTHSSLQVFAVELAVAVAVVAAAAGTYCQSQRTGQMLVRQAQERSQASSSEQSERSRV